MSNSISEREFVSVRDSMADIQKIAQQNAVNVGGLATAVRWTQTVQERQGAAISKLLWAIIGAFGLLILQLAGFIAMLVLRG